MFIPYLGLPRSSRVHTMLVSLSENVGGGREVCSRLQGALKAMTQERVLEA